MNKFQESWYNNMNKPYLKIKIYAQNVLIKTYIERDRGQESVVKDGKKYLITDNIQEYKQESRGKVFCYDTSSCTPYRLEEGREETEEYKPLRMRIETISPEVLQAAMEKQTVIDLMSLGIDDKSWIKWVVYGIIIIAIGYFAYQIFM